jgi:hypothetical protein
MYKQDTKAGKQIAAKRHKKRKKKETANGHELKREKGLMVFESTVPKDAL